MKIRDVDINDVSAVEKTLGFELPFRVENRKKEVSIP